MSCLGVSWFIWEPGVRPDSLTVWFMVGTGQIKKQYDLEQGLATPQRPTRWVGLELWVMWYQSTWRLKLTTWVINHSCLCNGGPIKPLIPRCEWTLLVGNTLWYCHMVIWKINASWPREERLLNTLHLLFPQIPTCVLLMFPFLVINCNHEYKSFSKSQ